MTRAQDNSIHKILVIKLGALGDFIQGLSFMAAIRKHHPTAHITILTTEPFASFANDCGYFNDVWIDKKPKLLNVRQWLAFRAKLNTACFARVYDLQNNDRTAFYLKLCSPKPEWVGTIKGASHRNTMERSATTHEFEVLERSLALADITNIEIDDLSWMRGDISRLKPNAPYMLIVPGCAPQHPGKRWPSARYGQLAKQMVTQGITPVIIGTAAERITAQQIKKLCPASIDLLDQTSFAQIAALAKNARFTIGNDTGPMHLIAATGCPSIVLFSKNSNPARHKPKGSHVYTLQKEDLKDLNVETVLHSIAQNIQSKTQG